MVTLNSFRTGLAGLGLAMLVASCGLPDATMRSTRRMFNSQSTSAPTDVALEHYLRSNHTHDKKKQMEWPER